MKGMNSDMKYKIKRTGVRVSIRVSIHVCLVTFTTSFLRMSGCLEREERSKEAKGIKG